MHGLQFCIQERYSEPIMSAEDDKDLTGCETCMTHKPTEPLASDCCGTGCNPCVFDLYETELATWRKTCDRCHEGGAKTKHQEPAEHQLQDTSSLDDALSPEEYRCFKLQSINRVSRDTATYTFTLPDNSRFNLGIGQHIVLRGPLNDRFITRHYTPISPPGQRNSFDILIKTYEDGAMSNYIKQWTEGDSIEWRGPYGTLAYQANQYRRIVMLAAGTGITPMLQVIRQIVTSDEEETFVHLLYACKTYGDILLRDTLNEFTAFWNFTVLYALSQDAPGQHPTSYGESFHYGRIDQDILATEKETSAEEEKQFLICGTKSFEKDMINFLKRLQFKGNIFTFR